MNKVKYRVFIRWNALGATIFAGGVAVLGYVFAGSLDQLEKFLKYWAIGFFALIVITVLILKRKLEHLLED
jgi:membrane protein DedA with SNARE-associated domain